MRQSRGSQGGRGGARQDEANGSQVPFAHAMQPLLGQRLKALRQERGLSISEVAAATGISRSFLSLVEGGKSDITLGRLITLLAYFGVSITDLVPDAAPPPSALVTRVGEERHITSGSEGIDMLLLRPSGNGQMQPFLVTYEPGARQAEHASHTGEEFVLVLEGEVTLQVGAERTVLRAGDSAYYQAEVPHSTSNEGKQPARAFVMVTPAML